LADVAVQSDGPGAIGADAPRRSGDLVGSFVLAYGVAIALLWALLYNAGVWSVAAYTRFLDIAINAGFVQLHDAQPGFIAGVPELELFQKSQEPIDIRLVFLAGAVLLLHWFVKAAQFHSFARMVDIPTGFGQNARSYLYGDGLNRLTPYNFGQVASASSLQANGGTVDQAGQVLFLGGMFALFEILIFAAVGLYQLGLTQWLTMLVWPVGILLVSWMWTKPLGRRVSPVIGPGSLQQMGQAVRALAQRPLQTLKNSVLSIAAFLLAEFSVFLIMMALTTEIIILNIDTPYIIMGVVGGLIARQIPITPGGLGQFEWGFAGALYLVGKDLPGVATIILFHTFVRYVVGTLLFGVVTVAFGSNTSYGKALALFRRSAPASESAS